MCAMCADLSLRCGLFERNVDASGIAKEQYDVFHRFNPADFKLHKPSFSNADCASNVVFAASALLCYALYSAVTK